MSLDYLCRRIVERERKKIDMIRSRKDIMNKKRNH